MIHFGFFVSGPINRSYEQYWTKQMLPCCFPSKVVLESAISSDSEQFPEMAKIAGQVSLQFMVLGSFLVP